MHDGRTEATELLPVAIRNTKSLYRAEH
jgi:hypothetical protein